MLGTRRSGVTVAINLLNDYGLIEHARNRIVLLKRAAIQERACDCYTEISTVVQAFDAQLRSRPQLARKEDDLDRRR